MHSTFSGLEIGKRGVLAHQSALNTTGHNITNMNTEGYSRQRVHLSTVSPLYDPSLERVNTPGQMGQGPQISQIERIFNVLHEDQILSTADDLGYWQTQDMYLRNLEMIYAEPNETSLRHYVETFWGSWQDLANNPESLAHRSIVVENGKALTEAINHRFEALTEQRKLLNDDVKGTVALINDTCDQIATLNKSIALSRAEGDNPNDLLDKRDLLVDKLAMLVPVTVEHRDSDEFQVHVYGRVLVQGDIVKPLTLKENFNDPGMLKVEWDEENSLRDYMGTTGKLAALLDLRDTTLRQEVQKIDTVAIHFSDLVNSVHREGYGRNGINGIDFFTQLPIIENANGNYDSDGDGAFDRTYLFRMTGTEKLNAKQPVGFEGVMTFDGANGPVEVKYYASDTVEKIVERINYSNANVTARLDSDGYLSLKGTVDPSGRELDFVIHHVEDSGQFLVDHAGLLQRSGAEGAYDYRTVDAGENALRLDRGVRFSVTPLGNPAAWIGVNPYVASDVNFVAATRALPTGEAAIGDNHSALAIADLRYEKVMIDRLTSIDDFFVDSAALVGEKGQQAQNTLASYESLMRDLSDIKQSFSGVNINEEFSDLVRFQHAFAASARFVSEVDKMLDTIVNRLGA